MKERPIIFSAPMVRAIIAGEKTQTRRAAGVAILSETVVAEGCIRWEAHPREGWGRARPGDRLWVREAAYITPPNWPDRSNATHPNGCTVSYVADYGRSEVAEDYGLKQTPSIYMPRWASRITLEVTDVRAERLQDITEADAIAEGAHEYSSARARWSMERPHPCHINAMGGRDRCLESARMAFANQWNVIHGGKNWNLKGEAEPWTSNPWVWVITFRRLA